MIAIIAISYKKPELIRSLLESLCQIDDAQNVHLLVVDNAVTHETRSGLEPLLGSDFAKRLGRFEVLFEQKNWGYFGGAQRGLEHLRSGGTLPQFDWVAVSNSDIQFQQKDILRRLAQSSAELNGNGRLGAIAPRVLSGLSGGDQNPFMVERPTGKRMQAYQRIFARYWSGSAYKFLGLVRDRLGLRRRTTGFEKPVRIYAPHGSFILFAQRYLAAGLDFSHGAFLFNEEITVGERCRLASLEIWYDPRLSVFHDEHATMGGWPSRQVMEFHREASHWTAETFFK